MSYISFTDLPYENKFSAILGSNVAQHTGSISQAASHSWSDDWRMDLLYCCDADH